MDLSRDGSWSQFRNHRSSTTNARKFDSPCDQPRAQSTIGKKITPHMLRHSTAMRLLHAGVDITVIALRLGHESVATTQIYVHADLALNHGVPRQPGVAPF